MKRETSNFRGKAIYRPTGKAAEYCQWACNLYNGCSHNCAYCYNNKGITSGVLGGTDVRIKSTLINEEEAFNIFSAELLKWRNEIITDGGLHFNFVSDPCLPETINLNWKCIGFALSHGVPVQVLTKRADWLSHPTVQDGLGYKSLIRVGFSLTGCDELEPGASPNSERIWALQVLHNAGISTWASIEPIIDPQWSLDVVKKTIHYCNHYKIGVLSGKKSYTPEQIRLFVKEVNALAPLSVYWKKSLLEFIY